MYVAFNYLCLTALEQLLHQLENNLQRNHQTITKKHINCSCSIVKLNETTSPPVVHMIPKSSLHAVVPLQVFALQLICKIRTAASSSINLSYENSNCMLPKIIKLKLQATVWNYSLIANKLCTQKWKFKFDNWAQLNLSDSGAQLIEGSTVTIKSDHNLHCISCSNSGAWAFRSRVLSI